MTYADNLDDEGITSQYLVVIKPRRLLDPTAWTNVSGTLYTQTFTLGEIQVLADNGTEKTEATSSALSDGDWFFDTTDSVLYFDDGGNPTSGTDIVVTYDIYLGTFDAHFNQDPLDSSSRVVYFEPLITQSPQINQSSTEDLFGFLPTIATTITIANTTQFLQEHVYASSFHNCKILVYHYLGSLTTANTKLVTSGFCSTISYKETATTIEVFDNRALFDEEFRHPTGLSFFASGTLPAVDPDFDGRPIRRVFGVVDKFIPVNIDFNADAPTVTNNRRYIVMNPHDNIIFINATVSASPASTTTRTYIDSADGLRVGDAVWIDKATDEYVNISAVNKTGSHYIEHDTLTGGAALPADIVKRGFLGNVIIYRSGFAPLKLEYPLDYTVYQDATNKLAGFTLVDNFEARHNTSGEMFYNSGSNATSLLPSDLVYCRVYGNTNQETLGGSSFGSDSSETSTLAQAIVVMYSLLKNNIGLTESEIDTTTISSLQSSVTDEIGLAIPQKNGDDFPKYRDILTQIFQTLLLKFLINDDGKYSVTQTAPIGAVSKTIEDDEILRDSFEYLFNYKDIISDIIVEYDPKEVSTKNNQGDLYYNKVTSSSNLAKRLHNVTKQKTFKSLHFTESEAQTLANRLQYALGDRNGRIKIRSKTRFFDTELNEALRISRARMPGFEYVSGTKRNRDGAVVSTFKSLTQIDLEIDDQKGIEDNSGSW